MPCLPISAAETAAWLAAGCVRRPSSTAASHTTVSGLQSFLPPLLDERFAEAEEGDQYVLPMLIGRTDASLRKTLQRAIRRAGVEPWPRLWHNMRATRQTELEDQFPSHVVCAWLGNSKPIAAKHYLQVTDTHFRKAAQNPTQTAHESSCQALTVLPQSELEFLFAGDLDLELDGRRGKIYNQKCPLFLPRGTDSA